MIDTPANAVSLSRRGLLKVGLLGGTFLGTAGLAASLSGCSSPDAASGFVILRESDLEFFRALVPVMLNGAVADGAMPAAVDATLQGIDHNLNHVSPELLKLTRQLLDVLAMGATRGPLTGIWGSWDNASAADIRQFLSRWEHSSLELLRMGHESLVKMVLMSWYARPQAWAHCGYPGPPSI